MSHDLSCYVAVHSYGLNGKGIEAVELYRRMPPDLIEARTHICVLNACSHSGLFDEARSIFREITTKTERIYTAMVHEASVTLVA
jgi:pentatricopeptide repeat protein